MKYFILSMILLVTFSISAVECEKFANKRVSATVTYVNDGDTAKVKTDLGENIKVRFYGVDTPESEWQGHWPEQPHSAEAKKFTVNKLKNKSVDVLFTGEGTHSRCVGEIFVNNKSHSLELVKHGHGWWYQYYSPERRDLQLAQETAKNNRLGLWANTQAIAPWDFRKQHSK